MSEPDGTEAHEPPAGLVPQLTEQQLDELRAMFDLARDGEMELARYVDLGIPVNLTNDKGDSLLILATYHQRHELARALVERGADLERENERGQTALSCAVFRQDAELVRLLVGAGADPDGGAQSGRQVAAFFGLDEMSQLLDAPRPGTGEALR